MKTRIYPFTFTTTLLLVLSLLTLGSATLCIDIPLAALPLIACGLALLCYTLYVSTIVSFDRHEISILRLFPGRTTRIRWEDVQHIAPLESSNYFTTIGYVCRIYTAQKTYSLFPLSPGFYKLLKHWDTVKPSRETPPLLLNKLSSNGYRIKLWKNPGVYISILQLGLMGWLLSSLNERQCNPAMLIGLLVATILILLLVSGPYFNYYEFTSTHFRIRSPFFFWQYEVRWEDIRAIRMMVTNKNNSIIICNQEYRYRVIIVGYLPPNAIIAQLQKANIPIQIL